MVSLDYTLSFREYRTGYWAVLWHKRSMWFLVIMFVGIAIAGAVKNDPGLSGIGLIYVPLLLLNIGWPYIAARKKIKPFGIAKWDVSDEQLRFHGPDSYSEIPWRLFKSSLEYKSGFIMTLHPGKAFFTFPKRAFNSEDDMVKFRGMLASHGLGKPADLPEKVDLVTD